MELSLLFQLDESQVFWAAISLSIWLGMDKSHLQPVNFHIVCKREDELVDNSINTYRTTYELQLCVIWIIENEVMPVEV
jgi:hypothetical protein